MNHSEIRTFLIISFVNSGGLDFESKKFRFTALRPKHIRIQGANHLPKI